MAKATKRRPSKKAPKRKPSRATKPKALSIEEKLRRQGNYDHWFRRLSVADARDPKIAPQDFTNEDLSEDILDESALHRLTPTRLRFIDAVGVRYLYEVDGHPMLIVRHDSRVMVRHGCHWFSYSEAIDWWMEQDGGSYYNSGNDWNEREATRATLRRIKLFAQAHGWKLGL